MSVQDSERTDDRNKSVRYCEALFKLLRSRNKDILNKISEIIKLQSWTEERNKNSRMLKFMKFYDVFLILRSVHVMLNDKDDYYINNYEDWNTYNTIYDADFLKNEARKVDKYRRINRQWKSMIITILQCELSSNLRSSLFVSMIVHIAVLSSFLDFSNSKED